ncbi:unnamed protein product [Orchesella dallaii]|uniref:Uncharacterized protein n=1 Tax=Orchesella dallaii TaxID=48710 RepID=A0ABP1RE74_9HEXA
MTITPKFIKAVGVLFILGISLKSNNGNSHGLFGGSSHGFRWGLHKTSLNSTTINSSTDDATTTTGLLWYTLLPFQAHNPIQEDGAIVLTSSDPDRILNLTSGTSYHLRSSVHEYSGYCTKRIEIVIHLWNCDYDEDEYIEIYANRGYIKEKWKCDQNQNQNYQTQERSISSKYYTEKGKNATALLAIDGINGDDGEAWIAARFNSNSTREGHQSKATVVVNIYWKDHDSQKTCGSRCFNCFESYDYCPPCCDRMDFRVIMCIPIQLQCNGRPNCGPYLNTDETYETCNLKTSCPPCPSFCLPWNYIIKGLTIAVLFIGTPTLIAFRLFYRRSLERDRLERYTPVRMADMRGEFTLDSSVTDVPPSYEEVYGTKEPPPCFYQAVAMGEEVEVLQLQAQNVDRINGDQDVDVTN